LLLRQPAADLPGLAEARTQEDTHHALTEPFECPPRCGGGEAHGRWARQQVTPDTHG